MSFYGPGGWEESQPKREFKLPIAWGWLLIIPILLWLGSGFYIVGPDQQGIVKRFGRLDRVTGPGLNYHLPAPLESVLRPNVTEVKRIELGFQTVRQAPPAQYRSVPQEAKMLTGDENIVMTEAIVQYRISDPAKYLFSVKDPDGLVRDAAEAALRQVVGSHDIDFVLTVGKGELQEKTMEILQMILDRHDAGVVIWAVQLQDVHPPNEVSAAFKDVASAREDMIKFVNEAEGYRNDLIPRARGEAQTLIRQAEAYREERIQRAQGDVARFVAMHAEYVHAPEVTRTRLYIEAMEEILPNMEKVLLTSGGNDSLLKLWQIPGGGGSR